MKLEQFKMQKFDDVYNLLADAFDRQGYKENSDAKAYCKQKLANTIKKYDTYKIFVVKENKKIVATCIVYIHPDPFDTKDFATIWYGAVNPDLAGRGIGTFMLTEVCKELKSQGINSVRYTTSQDNIACNKMGQKAGFEKRVSYKKILN